MTFKVTVIRHAERQSRDILKWIADRSIQGADRWLSAYDQMIDRLEHHADECSLAPENESTLLTIRQIHFKTPHGRPYRALFTIDENDVRVLAIRGPGQDLVPARDLER